jgi:hypothetical protein
MTTVGVRGSATSAKPYQSRVMGLARGVFGGWNQAPTGAIPLTRDVLRFQYVGSRRLWRHDKINTLKHSHYDMFLEIMCFGNLRAEPQTKKFILKLFPSTLLFLKL